MNPKPRQTQTFWAREKCPFSRAISLAGIATGPDGTPVLFALMADRIDPAVEGLALEAMDEAAAALGGCRCGR